MENQYLAAFAEIDIQEIGCIRFMMPELDAGRNDIEITVEYGQSQANPNVITANAWARVGSSNLKGFLCTQTVLKSLVEENGYTEIAMALNQNPVFYQQLQAFLVWADNNISE